MPTPWQTGVISFAGDTPMHFTADAAADAVECTEEQKHIAGVLGKTVRAYREAAKSLLNGKYSHLKEFAPEHLAEPGNIQVIGSPNGVVIRYEKKSESPKVLFGWMPQDLRQVAAMLSQNLIQCHTSRQFTSTVDKTGFEIKLFRENRQTGHKTELYSMLIGFDVVIDRPEHTPAPPQKPFCLLSIRNLLEIGLAGELLTEGAGTGEGQSFVSRSKFRLPVGWECIEVYPSLDMDAWKPENAPAWAEKDILAAVVAKQMMESHYQSLDPNAAARRDYANLLKDFKALLESNPEREEVLQVFLREHPFLLCPAHTKMWPKLRLGDKETDFVFRDAKRDYILVELEKSTHPLFRQNGHARQELNTAIGQIMDWKRYIEDNLRTVQGELALSDISTNPQGIVVIGRSHGLSAENRRKLTAMENAQPKIRILTYDDVHDDAKAVIENLLGPIWEPGGQTQIYYPR